MTQVLALLVAFASCAGLIGALVSALRRRSAFGVATSVLGLVVVVIVGPSVATLHHRADLSGALRAGAVAAILGSMILAGVRRSRTRSRG